MRLTLTLPEIEKGSVVIGGRAERQLDIMRMARTREPFACHPVTMHDGKIIAAVIPTGNVEAIPKGTEMKFRPVWCKTFLVCSMRMNTITRIVVEFDFGKFMIDHEGVRKADLTLGGNGADPGTVTDSEKVFGRMLCDTTLRHEIFDKMIEFVKRSY